MKKVYQVAGHRFSLEMPEESVGWMEMLNYEPFLTDDADDCVFSTELIEELPDLTGKKQVTIGCKGKGFPRTELYELNEEWMMAIAPDIEAPVRVYVFANKSFTKARFRVLGSWRFSLNSTMMVMFAFSTARRNTLLVHASVTVNGGKGYLFLGKSGTGKSTHSQLWIDNIEGSELLNDDNPILRVEEDGKVIVYGSPWSGKTSCYRNLNYPVGAIVDLHQAKENQIRRLSLAEAYASMYVSFSGYRFIKEMADGLHATNAKVVSSVPCYSLGCLPNADAAWLCYHTVTQ